MPPSAVTIGRAFDSLEALLAEPEIGLILNLANPHSHFAVTKAALEAGKHVYSETPLAMGYAQAEALADLAVSKGLSLSGAPASILGEAGTTVRDAVAAGQVGRVRLVYAELEDGVQALAARPDVDIVDIATPNSDRMDSALACIEAGKAVLIEKPIALSAREPDHAPRRQCPHARHPGADPSPPPASAGSRRLTGDGPSHRRPRSARVRVAAR